ARMLWTTMYQSTQDRSIRANAAAHLRALQVDEDVLVLERLVNMYRGKTGRLPESFSTLQAAGLLRGNPADPLGHPYRLTPDGDWAALQPHSRRPQHSPTRIASALEQQVLRLRQRGWGPARIAPQLGLGHGSVQRILTRFGQNRLPHPVRPRPRRYEKQRPGE